MKYSKVKARRLFRPEQADQLDTLFSRRGLSGETRLLCMVACLQATGDSPNLLRMLELAISKPDDYRAVYEILLQGYLFCGYPRAIESFFCLEEVAIKRGFAPPGFKKVAPEDLEKRGRKTAVRIYRDKFAIIHNKISALSPDLGYLMVVEGYGRILSREGVGIGRRELAAVSSLSAIEAYRQLNSHIRGAINVGCRPREVFEAISSGAPWVGADSIAKSVKLWREIVGLPMPPGADECPALRV